MVSILDAGHYIDRLRSLIGRDIWLQALLLWLAAALLIGIIWLAAALSQRYTIQADDTALLSALWASYKQRSWDAASGRTFDAQNNNVTTSEGQAYTLLRAVWANDRPTFNLTWRWTATHLQRRDHLFSWRYGTRPDGTRGILANQGGQNSASDADVDIATALLMAGTTWHDEQLQAAGRDVVRAIWDQEVVMVRGQPYMAADDVEKTAATASFIVNPSYLAPYAFRVFDEFDRSHNWVSLADSSYALLHQVDTATLGSDRAAGLPPDWAQVDRRSGAVQASANPGQTTDFGYNAFRVLWRVGLDWQWFQASVAQNLFQDYQLLDREWTQHHRLAVIYHHSGRAAVSYESLALYGGSLGYFTATNRGLADEIANSKIRPLYDAAHHRLARPLSYYDNNWVWFGLALYDDKLPDLASGGSAP